jgi:hypothetical protein
VGKAMVAFGTTTPLFKFQIIHAPLEVFSQIKSTLPSLLKSLETPDPLGIGFAAVNDTSFESVLSTPAVS